MADYSKYNDYTLAEEGAVAGGTLTRHFNFAAATVTTIFQAKTVETQTLRAYGSDGGVSAGVGVAMTSQMQVHKFSELDCAREVVILHAKLVELGGTPPPLEEILGSMNVTLGKDVKVGKPFQLKP
jgi:hypothetical protein